MMVEKMSYQVLAQSELSDTLLWRHQNTDHRNSPKSYTAVGCGKLGFQWEKKPCWIEFLPTDRNQRKLWKQRQLDSIVNERAGYSRDRLGNEQNTIQCNYNRLQGKHLRESRILESYLSGGVFRKN